MIGAADLLPRLTPPELAKVWGVKPDRVIAMIRRGDLRAFNLNATTPSKRPRFLIDPDDVKAFERSRSVTPNTERRVRRKVLKPTMHFD